MTASGANASMIRDISESEFQRQVTDLASMLGWRWLHIERMGDAHGAWRTPASGPLGKGFPDLMLIRKREVIFIELKRRGGTLSADQRARLLELSEVGQCYVFRPGDWAMISEVLH